VRDAYHEDNDSHADAFGGVEKPVVLGLLHLHQHAHRLFNTHTERERESGTQQYQHQHQTSWLMSSARRKWHQHNKQRVTSQTNITEQYTKQQRSQ
jgi:hypothetical protein